jgi:hypothetical protein
MLGPAAATIGCAGVAPMRKEHGIGTALAARASEILRDRAPAHVTSAVRVVVIDVFIKDQPQVPFADDQTACLK